MVCDGLGDCDDMGMGMYRYDNVDMVKVVATINTWSYSSPHLRIKMTNALSSMALESSGLFYIYMHMHIVMDMVTCMGMDMDMVMSMDMDNG